MKDEKKKKQHIEPVGKVKEVIDAYLSAGSMMADPFGSYTGKAQNPYEIPVQDADDL